MEKMIEICFSPEVIKIGQVEYDQHFIDRNDWSYGGDSQYWHYCATMDEAKIALKEKIAEQLRHFKKACEHFSLYD